MRFNFYAGPFDLDVRWRRRAAPRAVNVPFLEYYRLRDRGFRSPYPAVRFDIREPVSELSKPPAGAIENQRNWRVWREGDGTMALQIWSGEARDYALEARISPDYLSTRVTCADWHPSHSALSVNLAEITKWVVAHLAFRHGGFLIHTSAVQHENGSVFLGLGPSGAGKSTFSRFFKRHSSGRILTDETCLVLREKGRFIAYGTPWPGMLNTAVNAGGRLAGIFMLEKTSEHAVRPLGPAEAMLRLTQELFIPPWDERVTAAALDSAERLVQAIPPRVLGFRKDKSVVPFVEELLYGKKEIRAADRDQSRAQSRPGPAQRL